MHYSSKLNVSTYSKQLNPENKTHLTDFPLPIWFYPPMQIISFLLLALTLSTAHANLVLIGGGKRPPEAMKEFVTLAGLKYANILIIPWASESTEAAENIKRELEAWGPGKVVIAPLRLNAQELTPFHLNLSNFSGIFFTGGNQNTLMTLLKEYRLVDLFRKKYKEGMIFAGTSAGTAIMSNPMLTGNGTELSEGLGLLPSHYIVDQHFIVRNRFDRLGGIILSKENTIGIGIDEDTALVIIGSHARVVGPSQVVTFEKDAQNQLKIIFKFPGEDFILSDQAGFLSGLQK